MIYKYQIAGYKYVPSSNYTKTQFHDYIYSVNKYVSQFMMIMTTANIDMVMILCTTVNTPMLAVIKSTSNVDI